VSARICRTSGGVSGVQQVDDRVGVNELQQGRHGGRNSWSTGDGHHPGAGADQGQPAAPVPVLHGELLRQTTTPGIAQDVDLPVAQVIE